MKNSPIADPITKVGVAHAFELLYILYNFQIQYCQMIDYICLDSLSSLNYLWKNWEWNVELDFNNSAQKRIWKWNMNRFTVLHIFT